MIFYHNYGSLNFLNVLDMIQIRCCVIDNVEPCLSPRGTCSSVNCNTSLYQHADPWLNMGGLIGFFGIAFHPGKEAVSQHAEYNAGSAQPHNQSGGLLIVECR